MPKRAPRLCSTCRQLVTTPRCPTCAPSWGTSTRRGSTRAWRRLRIAVFTEQGYICAVDGCAALCDELDHIVNEKRGGTDDRDNLQGLCADHHQEKTQREANDARHKS